jgi:hypothetical protein
VLVSRRQFRIAFVLIVVCVGVRSSLDLRGVSREVRGMVRSFRPTTLRISPIDVSDPAEPATSWKINLSLAIRAWSPSPSWWAR